MALALIVPAFRAVGADTFATGQLTISSLAIGDATYSNVVINVGEIISGPTGTAPNSNEDRYNPVNGQLSVPLVTVGTSTYYNVVASVSGLVSVGSVAGTDVYNGTNLIIPSVQVAGGSIYTNVVVTVGTILNVGGGMPRNIRDVYDPTTKLLTVAAVSANGKVYTNATATVSGIVSVGGGGAITACPTRGYEALATNRSLAFVMRGFDGAGQPLMLAGSATLDGKGKIVTAEIDYNGLTSGPQHLVPGQLGGGYSLGADHRGCIGFAILGAAPGVPTNLIVNFAFDGTGMAGRIVEFDASNSVGRVSSGVVAVQNPATFSASPGGFYAFGLSGFDLLGARFAMAGSLSTGSAVQGVTPITAGFADINSAGGYTGELTGTTGKISAISADGRATVALSIPTAGGGTYTFDFVTYVVNQSQWFIVASDSPNAMTPYLASGQMILSAGSYGSSAIVGSYMFGLDGYDFILVGNEATIGVFESGSAGALSGVSYFQNDSGSYLATTGGTGYYLINSAQPTSGRVEIFGAANFEMIVYLCNPQGLHQIAGFALGTDGAGSIGELVTQSASPPTLSNSSMNGTFTFGSVEDPDNENANYAGVFQFDGAGTYSFVNDVSVAIGTGPPYLQAGVTASQPYAVNADGTGTINGAGFALVTNGEQAFAIPTAVDGLLYVIQQ